MVQTRSATARIKSAQIRDNEVPRDVRPSKRQRRDNAKSSKQPRPTEGKELCQLNLDVLSLIAEYTHPVDLLNLARTCKPLRELLMNKSSVFIWKSSFSQVDGLPGCPADLTEPEYADLIFCARCHSCGKVAKMVLWNLRRRYCRKCQRERLRQRSSCGEIICANDVLPVERFSLSHNRMSMWFVDKDQMESLLDEYHRSADKVQFLVGKLNQRIAISHHASQCQRWEVANGTEREADLALCRQRREESIFERLEQNGYGPEIDQFSAHEIRDSYKAVFRSPQPLTDKEWDQMWPEWRDIMDNFRFRRLDVTIYQSRRDLLVSEYDTYVKHASRDGRTSSLLPHVSDLACFRPFQDIIRAPEGTRMNDQPFASAFDQLPDLVEGWRTELFVKFAELVEIGLYETSGDGRGKTPSGLGHTDTSSRYLDKLRLACAMFHLGRIGSGAFTYLDALSACMCFRDGRRWKEHETGPTGSIRTKFRIEFLLEAPYIVRACGLDPGVATADDMDHLDARLRCLHCKVQGYATMDWRAAMWHATVHKGILRELHSFPGRWQLVSGRSPYINFSQIYRVSEAVYKRCLLCPRRVGDARWGTTIIYHVESAHGIPPYKIKEGVHYTRVGICDFVQKS